MGLCNRLGVAARKSLLRSKTITWLSREALEMKMPALISLIYSWKGAIPIADMADLISEYIPKLEKSPAPVGCNLHLL